ncbi:MAG: HlyC/CorC family transporter [Candidatus Competibacterales bacterium]
MSDWPLALLLFLLILLIVLSGFFSGSETGLMAINRYRLRHRERQGDKGARRVAKLLEQPDRLIGIILLGNNFLNILASALATIIALRLMGEAGIAVATLVLTVLLLIFGEVTPKTLAAFHPERIAYPASLVLQPLLMVFYPVVWAVNAIANLLLRPLGVRAGVDAGAHSLSSEELRTVVLEAGSMIPRQHQNMLLSILDLENATVEDIMVPRNEVVGLDVEDPWENTLARILDSQYTRLPVYRGGIDQVMGFLHMRQVVRLYQSKDNFTRSDLESLVSEPHFVAEGTSLYRLLLDFQQQQRRIALVVDEYGDVMGLVTMEDLLEEIVGEFTTSSHASDVVRQSDGSFLVNAGISVRTLNRILDWQLPIDGPKTLGGLILEYLEAIPDPGTCLLLADYPVEIVEIHGNRIKQVKMQPRLKRRRRSTNAQ